jgi:hypothetical protein
MTAESAELDLLIEHRERTAAFLAAKEAAQKGGPKAEETWRKTKDAMREWRRQWRDVREAFTPPSEDTATSAAVGLKARSK